MRFPSWLQLVLPLGTSTWMPVIFSVLPGHSVAWVEAYDNDIKSGVCHVAHSSPFDVFRKDGGVASHDAVSDSLSLNADDGDNDNGDDKFDMGEKAGVADLLSALMGKGGVGDLSSKAGDMSRGLADSLGGMQGLSTLLGDGFKNGDIEGLFKAAAGPLLSGGDSDFLDKLQSLVSMNSPEIKSLLDDLVSNPYMDVEEISMPVVAADVYAAKDSAKENLIPDSLKDTMTQPVVRPKPVVLRKIKGFAEAPQELLTVSDEGNGCHVLVLSGAGVKGAFQAGAVVGLAEQYKASGKQLRWDVVSGVSFGGVAAAFSLPFKPGRNGELDYGRSLWSFWKNLRFEDILKCKEGMRDLVNIPATLKWVADSYKLWNSKDVFLPAGAAHPCDPSPFKQTLRQQLTRHLGTSEGEKNSCADRRIATLTAAIMGGGEKRFTFTSGDVDGNCEASKGTKKGTTRIDYVVTAMLATSALPGIFPLVELTSEATRKGGDKEEGEGMHGQERKEEGGKPEKDNGDGEDQNAKGDGQKRGQRSEGEKFALEEHPEEVTDKWVLVDGSLTSYLNIRPAIKACQEKLTKLRRLPENSGYDLKERNARRTVQLIEEDELFAKEISEGKGIVFDFIVAHEVGTSATDENLEEMFDSEDDVFDNAASPLLNIAALAESFPQSQIRHVISYEDPAEVAHDVMDLRSVGALLEHGRVAGWKAATLKSVRAGRD